MEGSKIFAAVAAFLFFTCLLCARGQSQVKCSLIQGGMLGRTDTASTEGLISEAFVVQSGDNNAGQRPLVLLLGYNVVCLAAGSTRDTYQFVSVVANFSCSGTQSECDGNTLLSQFEFGCVNGGSGSEWSPSIQGSAVGIRTTPADGTLNTSTRTDCAICISPTRSNLANNTNHCLRMSFSRICECRVYTTAWG